MKQYLELLEDVLENGIQVNDRTETGTRCVFGRQIRFNLNKGFPLVTTKKVHLKSIIHELLWFLKGSTNVKYLNDNGVTIWNEWANERGELGPIYGSQWRRWYVDYECSTTHTIDQIKNAINLLKNNPDSRRNIVSAWNVGQLEEMALPPCHILFQFRVINNKLSCHMYQRSCDSFLGLPFNIASYALLTQMVAHVCNLELGELIISFGDVHIYNNHIEQVKEQLSRDPFTLPQMVIKREVKDIDDFKYEDFELVNYQCHAAIKAPISV